MITNNFTLKSVLKAAILVAAVLLLGADASFAQQQVNLTAQPSVAVMPDGTSVPMWGYNCGIVAAGSSATCATLNPAATATAATAAAPAAQLVWSPIIITVPANATGGLQINLTNALTFTPTGSATANTIPTSIVIVGQVGGGLGNTSQITSKMSPNHTDAQGCVSWFIASLPPGSPCTTTTPVGNPPMQANRVQSMATEVAEGTTASLPWALLKPGTYLLESGTHPSIQVPMGLIGMLVVTDAPGSAAAAGLTTGCAYGYTAATTGATPTAASCQIPYNAEAPFEFSEIDPVQNKEVDAAVRTAGFSETMVWSGMNTPGTTTTSLGGCAAAHTCYPPAVNYTPFYYLINGVAFNKTNAGGSLFPATAGVDATGAPVTTGITCTPAATAATCTPTVLVRFVNAGLRMHVPSIVGSQTQGFSGAGVAATVSGFTLISEDGNPVPNLAAPRVQTDVFMAAGKVFDVMVNAPAAATTGATPPSLPIYDRELSLSANSSVRDAGMVAYLGVNGAGLPVSAGSGVFAAAQANPDMYNSLIAGQPFSVSDPSKGVIANDINVYGVTLLAAPGAGTVTCNLPGSPALPTQSICANGTFTYTPNAGVSSDTFTYCANNGFVAAVGTTAASCTTTSAMVTLGASNLAGAPVANAITYTSKMATFLKIPSPGVLAVDSDPSGLPLTVALSSVTPAGVTLNVDPLGGFTASAPGAGTYSFTYEAQNSQGRLSAPATVTLIFPQPSNLQVKVLDAQAYKNCGGDSTCISTLTPFPDYRWIIEEDKTFWVDPNCTTNSSATTSGCPTIVGPSGQSTIPTFGVNFHTSNMDYVAQGCTGPLACEGGQTMLDTRPACTTAGMPAGCSTTAGQHISAVCDLGSGACRPDPTGNGFTPVNPSQVALDPSKRYYISVLPGDAANPFPVNATGPNCNGLEAAAGDTTCGHTMTGAPIPPACNILLSGSCTATSAFQPVNVLALPTPLPTGKLSVMVFEDDFPLNGEQDGGGGNGTIAPIEPGLGGFNLVLWDTYGGLGDVTGQDTYDAFNQPLSNSLAGLVDPVTNLDACPISAQATTGPAGAGPAPAGGITGTIVTCPKYESDGHTLSPLAGQAVIDHLMPDKFSVQAYPGADRIARGEEWIQTNTLDGQHPHDSFIRIGEPSYFQEFGPAGYHVTIGFANPALINARAKDVCAGAGSPGAVGPCSNTIDGTVDVQRLSRIPDERLYPSGSRDALNWTQCWVSLGDPDGEDFMFTKCDADGNFKFSGVPGGNWRLTIGDQWNDQIIDGLSTPANVGCVPASGATSCTGGLTALHLGNIGVQQWQSNLVTRTFIDDNKNGIWDSNEIGIPLIYTMIHYRDGSRANALTTDFNGIAPFNETFPLFNWYVVEADSTRYKTTGIHTVYDAGGPADGTCSTPATRACGTSAAYRNLSNTFEAVPLPADLSVPGADYCRAADCTTEANADFVHATAVPSSATASTGRIDAPWVWAEGWAGLTGHTNWIDFGKAPYAACDPSQLVNFCATVTSTAPGATTATTTKVGENGGIYGQIQYASTRPFDDAAQMVQQPWEPYVPHVTVNLYQEGFAADGVTPTLTLVDTTQSSSWDDWAQGFYPGSTATAGAGQTSAMKPYMSCPGQGLAPVATGTQPPNADLFFFTLFDQPNYLDWYNGIHSTPQAAPHALPYNSQFKCYDAMKINNQIQPAPYDGRYSFPSSLGINATTGKPLALNGSTNGVTSSMAGTNCTICVGNPDTTDPYRVGTPMLPPGKYTVEVIMPPGYEVYKEEDKNLLIGDDSIAPVTQQFAGVGGDIFILPDQANVAAMYDPNGNGYNPNNYQNETTSLDLQGGNLSGVPGFPGYTDPVWPCVGELRVVPDYLSLFPGALETAPFAGATRPLCDRKEVTLANQMAVRVKFAIFTSTHIAAHYTGVITDDLTSEFDPFSPQFGEKFAPPNMPISTKDYLGNELSRVYSDHWGTYDGLNFSSWEVNPPNITGYSPSMMTQCMNDPGPVLDTRATIVNAAGATVPNPTFNQYINDPLFNPAYSNFCYEEPYMPGLTTYLDTPVVPTQAFAGAGYNNADCNYPDATPAIKEADGDGIGPWVAAAGSTLTITALGDQQVQNSAYSGPSASVAPFNLKTVTRHYGFGAQCTAVSATCTAVSSVTIGGIPATLGPWTDTQIQVTVPSGVPNCEIQQQAQYGGSTAQCGQLVITAGNGKQSVDTVTVTIGGKAPKHIPASQSVQAAIDGAAPGDLLIIDPTCTTTGTTTTATCSSSALHGATPTQTASAGSHSEMLIMWKPVRLQGVGAVSSILNGNAYPAGTQLDPWRRHVNCLFGLSLSGTPTTTTSGAGSYDSTGAYSCPDASNSSDTWTNFTGVPNNPQVDRLPLEATVGWDATQNGNLAEQLQEPSLMGAYEGAGITVLGKGLEFHGLNPWGDGNEGGAFPTGTTILTGVGPVPLALPTGDANPFCHTGTYSATGAFTVTSQNNPYPSNFTCNPSSIDGLSIVNSSQGGGGIFAHGWAHHLQIANNRVYNNAGTLTGGISIGQGEFPTPYLMGSTTNAAPGSCSDGTGYLNNQHLPYCLQLDVNTHNNYVTTNSSLGDELFSGTLSGGGGATFCTGNDYYKFNYNWVCGNLSSGEGGGIVHLGEIQNGDIEHNSIVFNQSNNPTIPTNGGGIQVMGTPDTDPVCGTALDADCPPGLSDGTGHNLTINANLIQGNMAESGAGGGIRLQQVNGTDVSTFPGVYNITAATEAPTVTIRVPGSVPLSAIPRVNDSVTIAGVSVAAYNGTFTVTHVAGRTFQYIGATPGLATGTGGTFTDTTTAAAARAIASATDTAAGTVTITSTLSPTVGDTITITGFTGVYSVYNGTYTVTGVPTVGTFTYTGRTGSYQTFTAAAAGPFPTITDPNPNQRIEALWNSVAITNNIIVNNVAGWDGAGISLQDSLNVTIVNNTVAHNDALASSGVLTQSLGTPDASAPAGSQNCTAGGLTTSCPQSAGITSTLNSSLLTTTFAGLTVNCPFGEPRTGNESCLGFSNPLLANDLIYQNRSFKIGVTAAGTGNQNQQNLVALFNFNGSAAPTQTSVGSCPTTGVTYWDIGVRGDTGPTNHGSGFVLDTAHTLLTDGSNPEFVGQYCNGSRVPPECTAADGCGGPNGYGVPPGIADALTPNPVFTLTPAATVDEGNNWINVSWGPLSMTDPSIQGPTAGGVPGNYGGGLLLGNYSLLSSSPDIDAIPVPESGVPTGFTAPATDFFGNPRPDPANLNRIDYGAVEYQHNPSAITATLTSISPNSGTQGTTVNVTITGTNLTSTSAVNVSGTGITVSGVGVQSATTVVATFTITSTATLGGRNVTVTTAVGTTNPVTFTVTGATPTVSSISPNTGSIGRTGGNAIPVTITGTNLTGAAVTISGTGVTHSGLAVNAAGTQITTTFSIARTAAVGARTVTVTTAGGTATVTFTVQAAVIAFAGPTPALNNGATTVHAGIVVITNGTGANDGPLTITSLAVTKNAGQPGGGTFALVALPPGYVANPACAVGALAPGASCAVNVQYTPGAAGAATRTGHISLGNSSGAAVTPLTSPNFIAN